MRMILVLSLMSGLGLCGSAWAGWQEDPVVQEWRNVIPSCEAANPDDETKAQCVVAVQKRLFAKECQEEVTGQWENQVCQVVRLCQANMATLTPLLACVHEEIHAAMAQIEDEAQLILRHLVLVKNGVVAPWQEKDCLKMENKAMRGACMNLVSQLSAEHTQHDATRAAQAASRQAEIQQWERQAQQQRALQEEREFQLELTRRQALGLALFGSGPAMINGMNQGFQNMQVHPYVLPMPQAPQR